MSRWHAYLNTAKNIVESYDGSIPLSAWLKDFFRQHKQMGSNDRKTISQAAYCFCRLGGSIKELSPGERILTGLYLGTHSPSRFLAHFKPAWNDTVSLPLTGKIAYLRGQGSSLEESAIFPSQDELSSMIDRKLFSFSHLIQPDLFLRIRPQQEGAVLRKLTAANIPFDIPVTNCITLANATKVDTILRIDEEVVIQDYNSQRVGDFFPQQDAATRNQGISTWDCCAGSGGKSIMAHDLNRAINLTVSDARTSILQNLQQRFARARIHKYHSFVTDLAAEGSYMPPGNFECIIADVPCSGSGTWARTPEQLYFFDRKKIVYYSNLQKKLFPVSCL